MSGQGSRNRRRRQREDGRKRDRQTQQQIVSRYPVSPPWFYMYGETFTKFTQEKSPTIGPYCHIRACSGFYYGATRPEIQWDKGEGEEVLAWLDSDTGRWIINHRDANPNGYHEVILYIAK